MLQRRSTVAKYATVQIKGGREEFPDIRGFSPRNIWRMRAFYLAYTEEVGNLPHPAAVLSGLTPTEICQTLSGKFGSVDVDQIAQRLPHVWSAYIPLSAVKNRMGDIR